MQQISKSKTFFSKLQNNNSFIFGKKNKRKKSILNLAQAETNPVYRALKGQRNATSILAMILGAVQKKQENILPKMRSKSLVSEDTNHNGSLLERRNRSVQNLQQLKQRASKILSGTKKMAEQLEGSRRRISILDRFNKRVDKYCSFLPENPQEQQQNQSNIANDKQIKLCKQSLFPTEDLHKRANSLMHYAEPTIPILRLKKIKASFKITRTITNETQPLKRKLKTEPQQ